MMKEDCYKYLEIISSLAGYMHDLGKANNLFQEKIRITKTDKNNLKQLKDIVRHEFLSFYIVIKLIDLYEKEISIGTTEPEFINKEKWQNIFSELKDIFANTNNTLQQNKINNTLHVNNDYYNFAIKQDNNIFMHCILFCIITHHILPSSIVNDNDSSFSEKLSTALNDELKYNSTNRTLSIDGQDIKKLQKNLQLANKFYIDEELQNKINNGINSAYSIYNSKFKNSSYIPNDFFKSFSIVSRILLMMSDHFFSSVKVSNIEINKKNKITYNKIYANTNRGMGNIQETPTFNQTLDEHLNGVGEKTKYFLKELSNISLPVLNQETINKILEHSEDNFSWQNNAVDFIQENKIGEEPTLILNMATTGSGKTRMNAKALAALNKENLRITSIFNLKSLTLQTGKSYQNQLSIMDDDISILIGDENYLNVKNIMDNGTISEIEENIMDNDSSIGNDEYLLEGYFSTEKNWEKVPSFLKNKKKNGYKIDDFIGVPVLVSTIDFCINAGDLSKGDNHINAFLRIMTSDLIIDEIDSYEPEMLESVLRLISISAMNNKNIVISSATLSKEYINMINLAFKHGIELNNALKNRKIVGKVICISDLISSKIIDYDTTDDINVYIDKLCEQYTKNTQKLAQVIDISLNNIKNGNKYVPPIWEHIKTLHNFNNEKIENKNISFGLIRVGQIKNAVAFAKKFENSLYKVDDIKERKIEVKILTYHSNLLNSKRFVLEQFLDDVLNRNNNRAISENSIINDVIKNSVANNIIFIVIATPVEEIGRDHDFDWGIIEPSSIQSIIQTAGRVNRHRKISKDENPNIYILQYNLAYYHKHTHLYFGDCYFTKPGLEILTNPYEQDIYKLLPWDNKQKLYITSKLRYYSNFANFDDHSIAKFFSEQNKFRFTNNINKLWFRQEYYFDTILRKKQGTSYTYEINEKENTYYQKIEDSNNIPKPIQSFESNYFLDLNSSYNKFISNIKKNQKLINWSKQTNVNIYSDEKKDKVIYNNVLGFYFDK